MPAAKGKQRAKPSLHKIKVRDLLAETATVRGQNCVIFSLCQE
jgi:hypothetical protein